MSIYKLPAYYHYKIWESEKNKGFTTTHQIYDCGQRTEREDNSAYYLPEEICHSEAAIIMHLAMTGIKVKSYFIIVYLACINCDNTNIYFSGPKEKILQPSYSLTYKCCRGLKQFHGYKNIYITKNVRQYLATRRKKNDAGKRKRVD